MSQDNSITAETTREIQVTDFVYESTIFEKKSKIWKRRCTPKTNSPLRNLYIEFYQ